VIGEVGGAEVGEDAEAEVEAANEEFGGEFCEVGGDLEVGEEPERVGLHVLCDAADEGVELGLSEAVEKEVGYNEIVVACESEGEGVGLFGAQAMSGAGGDGFAALTEKLEHGSAGVDGEDMDVWVSGEERSGEAAVSVTEDEGAAAVVELVEVLEACFLESRAEGEVFEPAIMFGDGVEVRFGLVHR
jgi:hypothetical protein